MKKLILMSLCLLVVSVTGSAMAVPTEDTFSAVIDEQGTVTGSGTGYNDGHWYEYTNTNWWNQWFYDHPFDPTRWKEISAAISITSTDPGSWADIAVNWSSSAYPSNPDSPPLPPLNSETEDLWIVREVVFSDYVSGYVYSEPATIVIPDYNPEWVSTDIRGQSVQVEGWITHECIPEPATITLLGLGCLTLRRRRRKSQSAL